ncbi:MAG: Bax inhibitor-1/YccA family protein [Bacteroidetes bacterium]|nr:Bax inhibitor-1/YccA family protein [Bacteroidota bacterium]MBU1115915.1 Bax inhibitor-1/YccA family protein [Bacteroidota bacterium]MBU1798726.1 Bax inhibitor-1/YccA family protein [Bacteroidota bacterium]
MSSEIMTLSIEQIEERTFIGKVYRWMGIGLFLTAITAYFVASSESLVYALASNSILFFGLLIAEFGLVIYLSARIQKMSAETATAAFVIYSVLNGITLSLLLLVYTGASVASTFFTTALTFSAMSAYGYFTKRDLTTMGSYLQMGLIGLIIASVINIFWANGTMYWIISYVGVLLFVGLTAYDTQKIKKMGAVVEGVQTTQKMAIMGALTLYLDFINLFLMLLRILGDRK